MADKADNDVERFRPTSGRITGFFALATVAAIVLIGVFDRKSGFSATVVTAALAIGIVVWSAALRPRVWATERDLVMRNMFDTVSVPLAAIEEVAVRQVLAVRVGDKRYVSPSIGRSWRQALKARPAGNASTPGASGAAMPIPSHPDFVEDRIRQLAADARDKLGIAQYSDEQVALASGAVRRPAWIELAALTATIVALVVTLVI